MPIQSVVDAMLDVTWATRPLATIAIHVSTVNALFLISGQRAGEVRYRGCVIIDDLQTDQHVIISEAAAGAGWILAGNLHTGYITEAPVAGV
jgi:hypothetical protein